MFAMTAAAPRRPNAFVKAAFLRAQAGINRRPYHEFIPKDDKTSAQIIERAAAPVGTTVGAGWADTLAQTAYGEFIASLKPYSAAARIIAGAVQTTLDTAAITKFPTRAAGPAAPQWVAESGAIPVNVAAFSLIDCGPKRKIASIIPWTIELSKRSNALALFEQLLREDVGAGLDAAMLSTAAGSASAHAGLLNGVVAGVGFAGADKIAAETDLAALGEAVATLGSGQVLYIVSPGRLARLRVLLPDLAANLDVAASAAVPADRIVALEPSGIVTAVDLPDIDFGDQATIHMSDIPLPISSGGVADPVRDLWSTASHALRVIQEMTWAKRRAGAVAFLDNASW